MSFEVFRALCGAGGLLYSAIVIVFFMMAILAFLMPFFIYRISKDVREMKKALLKELNKRN